MVLHNKVHIYYLKVVKIFPCCFSIISCLSILSLGASAQFNSPTVDGIISAGEYGVHTNGQNQQATGTGQTWYVTWDNTNLYVAATNANLSERAVIYIDQDPINPPNGGTNANGNLIGNPYDGTRAVTISVYGVAATGEPAGGIGGGD